MDLDLIPLADAIAALRAQLTEAQRQGEDQEIRFAVGPVEVEFQVVASREGEAGGKIGFRLFGLGSEATARGKLGDARTQKIKITLTPQDDGGDTIFVADLVKRRRPKETPL